MGDFTDIELDEALRDREATNCRLAGGERLRLLKDGLPLAVVTSAEQLDWYQREPSSIRARPPTASAKRGVLPEDDDFERTVEAFRRGPTMSAREALQEEPPALIRAVFSSPEASEYFDTLRNSD